MSWASVVSRASRAAPLANRAVFWLRLAVIQAMASASLWASSCMTRPRMPSSLPAQAAVAGSDSMRETLAARSGWRAA